MASSGESISVGVSNLSRHPSSSPFSHHSKNYELAYQHHLHLHRTACLSTMGQFYNPEFPGLLSNNNNNNAPGNNSSTSAAPTSAITMNSIWESGLITSGPISNRPHQIYHHQADLLLSTSSPDLWVNGRALNPSTNQGRSGPSSNKISTKKPRRRVATLAQRRAANIRERRRMYNLNEAFDKLRRKVPTFAYEKRLSRIETLRLAITYISFMADILTVPDRQKGGMNNQKNSHFYGGGNSAGALLSSLECHHSSSSNPISGISPAAALSPFPLGKFYSPHGTNPSAAPTYLTSNLHPS